jgi:hypothetical protein
MYMCTYIRMYAYIYLYLLILNFAGFHGFLPIFNQSMGKIEKSARLVPVASACALASWFEVKCMDYGHTVADFYGYGRYNELVTS